VIGGFLDAARAGDEAGVLLPVSVISIEVQA
jgi:hypothetical protein